MKPIEDSKYNTGPFEANFSIPTFLVGLWLSPCQKTSPKSAITIEPPRVKK